MKRLSMKFYRFKTMVGLLTVSVLLGAGFTRCWMPHRTHAADQSKASGAPENGKASEAREALQARWTRLRTEYVTIASSIGPDLSQVDRLADLRRQTTKAGEATSEARLARQLAETALKEYTERIAGQELKTAQGEIDQAEASLAKAEKSLESIKLVRQSIANRLDGKGNDLTVGEILARFNVAREYEGDQLAVQKCKDDLELAKVKQSLLTRFSQKKRQAGLQSDYHKKRGFELACEMELNRARSREQNAKLEAFSLDWLPVEKKVVALLVEAASSPGSAPPWEGEPTAFKGFLDRFEAELNEVRPLLKQVREEREMEQFKKLTARLLREQDRPVSK